MEQYDYRQHDRIWQRVAPGLNPYPDIRAQNPPAASIAPTESTRAEETLPGAQQNPCCMGTAAMESLEVLKGFIEEELTDRADFLALSRQAPNAQAARTLRAMAAEEGSHARRLLAVYYLITGQCYQPGIPCGRTCTGSWCAALREQYHQAACSGFNYIRAAEGTTDPCLSRLLTELSQQEYRQADQLLSMLERSL